MIGPAAPVRSTGPCSTGTPAADRALASDTDPEDTPLVVRLRERLAALEEDPRWPGLRERLGGLRDMPAPSATEVERLAAELAGVLPRELVRTTWPMPSGPLRCSGPDSARHSSP